ncbi:MAG TPA: hypothetical protein VKU93_04250, partial [Terracidiphilus sp.]|nr:hypothetical protein [Terracidiphilus sp.]
VSDETVEASRQAYAAAQAAAPFVTRNRDEYERIVNDMHAICLLMQFYNDRIRAAQQVMLYGYDRDATHLQRARPLLAESVERLRELTGVAGPAYRTATGMETTQRQIPFRGGMKDFPGWQQCLPMYEKELAIFDKRIAQLSSGAAVSGTDSAKTLPQVAFTLRPGAGEVFTVATGADLFTGSPVAISALAPELAGMKGIRIAPEQGGTLRFRLAQDAQILVGFTRSASRKDSVLDPETEQWNLVLLNAVSAPKMPSMAVWARPLSAGENELDLGKGRYVVLGFIPADYHVAARVNFAQNGGDGPPNLDWLFE